jgi:hypothetical protein
VNSGRTAGPPRGCNPFQSFGLSGPPQGAYRARRRSTQWGCGNLEMVPNAILAHRLIEHAAIPYRIPVGLNRE